MSENNNYPQSGQPYTQSGQPYPQSGQPYTQSGQPFPQSGQPYPQSGQAYPQSGQQPYPISGYVPEQDDHKKLGIVAIVSIICVLVVALIAVLIITLHNTGNTANTMNGQFMPPPPPPMGMDMMDYTAYAKYETEVRKLVIDDQEISLPQYMLNINDLSFISIQDFANVFGYETVLDMRNRQTTVSKGDKSAVFSSGIATVYVTDGENSKEIAMADKPMMFTNNQVYVPLSSMKDVFNFESIDWDGDTKTVSIKTDGVTLPENVVVEKSEANVVTMDPNMMPPPPGGMPQGEMPQGEMLQGGMPQGEMPQGGMPQGQPPQQ